MQAILSLFFILAIIFVWWLYEKHDNNPPDVEN